MKHCPFREIPCNCDCPLFVKADELNETVANRLKAIGVLTSNEGLCSFKNMALAQNRFIFENTVVYKK